MSTFYLDEKDAGILNPLRAGGELISREICAKLSRGKANVNKKEIREC